MDSLFSLNPALRGCWQVRPRPCQPCQPLASCLLATSCSCFELPGWAHSSRNCIFFFPLFPFPLPGAPFDLVLVKSCRTQPRATVQVQSSRAQHRLLGINLPGNGARASQPCQVLLVSGYPTESWMGAGAPASNPMEKGPGHPKCSCVGKGTSKGVPGIPHSSEKRCSFCPSVAVGSAP